jgi:hypothetical protein
MKPLRSKVALAIDGGGIRGALVAKALAVVEQAEQISFAQVSRLNGGTSTGSIISASLSVGLSAARIHELYCQLGANIFPTTWRSRLWLLTNYRYSNGPLIDALKEMLGDKKMGDLWSGPSKTDLVIVLRDLVENRARFVKPWKKEYQDWPIWEAVTASCTVPTYFPVFKGRYIDGGVGSYSNPCYLTAFESTFCLQDWHPEETTLISLGTGSTKTGLEKGAANSFHPWNWIGPVMDAFTIDAACQQVRLVHHFFEKLDFRRFQIELEESVPMDDSDSIARLTEYGAKLGHKILNDEWVEIEEPLETTVMG